MNTTRFVLPFLCLALAAAGCSENVGVPTQTSPAAFAMGGPGLGDFNSRWIGPAGGTLSLSGVRLDVPQGALSSSTLITMEREADGSVDLSPDGQTFAVPVLLTFSTEPGQDPETLCVQWFNPQAGAWTTIPSLSKTSARAAELAHFSIYRIMLND